MDRRFDSSKHVLCMVWPRGVTTKPVLYICVMLPRSPSSWCHQLGNPDVMVLLLISPSNPEMVCLCTAAKVTIVTVTSASNPDVTSSSIAKFMPEASMGAFPTS